MCTKTFTLNTHRNKQKNVCKLVCAVHKLTDKHLKLFLDSYKFAVVEQKTSTDVVAK